MSCLCTECEPDQIKCRNGLCKVKFWQCDGVNDCGDSTDEENCGKSTLYISREVTQYYIIIVTTVYYCVLSVGSCKSGEFTCRNGSCISERLKCDGRADCADGSDESNCAKCTYPKINSCSRIQPYKHDLWPLCDWLLISLYPALALQCSEYTYKCKNNMCISKLNPECDEEEDCDDGSDEADCRKFRYLTQLPLHHQTIFYHHYPDFWM